MHSAAAAVIGVVKDEGTNLSKYTSFIVYYPIIERYTGKYAGGM
jgi:hypothetical protein